MAFLRPIPIFPKILNIVFCFIIKKCDVFYALPFFKTLKIRIYKQEFLKLQHFQYLIVSIVYAVYNE